MPLWHRSWPLKATLPLLLPLLLLLKIPVKRAAHFHHVAFNSSNITEAKIRTMCQLNICNSVTIFLSKMLPLVLLSEGDPDVALALSASLKSKRKCNKSI